MKKILLILSALPVILYILSTNSTFLNYIGKELFLTFHLNKAAIEVLEHNKEKDSDTYYLLSRLYFVEGALTKATQSASSAIELNPNVKEYYYSRGLSLGFTSPIFNEDAGRDFEKYIELEKKEFEQTGKHAYGAWAGYNDLAWIYFMRGDFNKARAIAEEGLAISGTNPWLSNMLGTILLEQGDCVEGMKHLENAKALIGEITTKEFGEAYSGDSPSFWSIGKQQMEESITHNLTICKKEI